MEKGEPCASPVWVPDGTAPVENTSAASLRYHQRDRGQVPSRGFTHSLLPT